VKLSVVIPAFNEAAHIADQLAALAAQEYPGEWEVLVGDNGSTDDTARIVQAWFDRLPLKLVDASARRGGAPARNIAIEASDGDALLFCDADDVVGRGWLRAHAAALERVALSGGAVVHFKDKPADGAPVATAPETLLGWLPYAQTANCAVRREACDAVCGFNEENAVAEDVEFSWLVQLHGYSFGYTPAAVVHKRARGTARDLFVQNYRYGKCDVYLFRRYRDHGATRPPARSLTRTYVGLIARLPGLGSSEIRERWIHQAGRRTGRLVGSFKERTFLP
jgi:glycosyltransferase involved in cell wall biosynthesis